MTLCFELKIDQPQNPTTIFQRVDTAALFMIQLTHDQIDFLPSPLTSHLPCPFFFSDQHSCQSAPGLDTRASIHWDLSAIGRI